MATHDYVIANGTGAAVRSDLNNALAAIVSNNSGSSEPGTTYAYQWWADTNANVLKIRNSSNDGWITLRELDGTMLIEDGSASTPGLAFASDLDTGIFRPSSNQIALATNGENRLQASTSECVVNEGSQDFDFRVESNGQTHMLFVDGGADAVCIGTSTPGDAQADNLTIADSANCGITIRSGTSNKGQIYFSDATSGDGESIGRLVYTHSDNAMFFTTNSSEGMRLDSSGRLLAGTSSTSAVVRAVFEATSGGSGGGTVLISRGTATPTTNQTLGEIYFADSGHEQSAVIGARRDSGTWTSGSSQPTYLRFDTTADGASSTSERMRINADGSIFFGRTNSTIDNSNHGMVFHASNRLDVGRNVSATGSVFQAFGGNGQFRIMGDGDAENTNNRYTGISDIKYKQNVQNASSQWDDIKAIQVRKYELIANPGVKHIGVVAQELEQICPGLVIERTVDEETGETAKSVAYSVLYMKAVKALQEAMERIETLEAKVAALEAG